MWQAKEELGEQIGWPFPSVAILKWKLSSCSFGFLKHHFGNTGMCSLGNLCSVHLILMCVCTNTLPGRVGHKADLLNDSEGCEATDMVHLFITKCSFPTTVSLRNT